jgi:phage tail-like protein
VHRLPTRIKQGNITLKRGITTEKALLQWYEQTCVKVQPTDLAIHVLDSEGKTIQTWSFRNAFPVKWTGSDLNAGGSEFLTQSLEIAHSGMKVM